MNKSIEFIQSQIEAYENGATMFMFPCVHSKFEMIAMNDNFYVENYSPLQIGDKNIKIKEKFTMIVNDICEVKNCASKMTKEQSRYTLKEILNVKIVKVQDILYENSEWMKINPHGSCGMNDMFYNKILKEQNINRTYEDNDYLFLVEIKR